MLAWFVGTILRRFQHARLSLKEQQLESPSPSAEEQASQSGPGGVCASSRRGGRAKPAWGPPSPPLLHILLLPARLLCPPFSVGHPRSSQGQLLLPLSIQKGVHSCRARGQLNASCFQDLLYSLPEFFCLSFAVAERVRQRTHRLQDNALDVSPYYEFLEPLEEEDERGTGPVGDWGSGGPLICMPLPEAAAIQRLLQLDLVLQELSASVPKCTLAVQGASLHVLGGDPALRRQLQQHVQEALQGVAEERLPFPAWILSFLQRKDVQEHLAELLVKRGLGACYVPDADAAAPAMLVVALWPSAARQAASLLSSSLCSFSLPLSEQHLLALTSSGWARVQTGLPCCLVRLADSGEHLEGLTLSELEQGNVAQLMAFLEEARPDETLVPMEAGTLRYLQLYSQELLASIASVSLLPLEGPDITGLRVRLSLPPPPPSRMPLPLLPAQRCHGAARVSALCP